MILVYTNAFAPRAKKAMDDFIAHQPGRMGKAEEVAALAVYRASDSRAFTTGQTLTIDGGWSN